MKLPTKGPVMALDDGTHRWTYAALDDAVERQAAWLRANGVKVMATLMGNSPAWVVIDLAAARANVVHVPLPLFFAAEQIAHALRDAGVDTLVTLPSLALRWSPATPQDFDLGGETLSWLRLPSVPVVLPVGTAKITFTSGSTGAPKGVCLGAGALDAVARGLVEATAPIGIERHLCALPFPVLLENVAGLAAPLLRGATCIVPPLQSLGLSGASSFDAALFHDAVCRHEPHSVILLPQMLRAWTAHLASTGRRGPESLRLVAVGGAAVGASTLRAARALGIPAYEGYGLSEGASVQTLNLPGADRAGAAGKPLPHSSIRIAADGEIEIQGSLFSGYLGDAGTPPLWWPTGDLGHVDADGFVHVSGRKKNVLITAFGRNVSPEWVETTLKEQKAVMQAVVLGDAQPFLSAVLWPVSADLDDAALQSAVDQSNATLPDYARVRRWIRAGVGFDALSGMATVNGRPRRDAILERHRDALGIADS